MEGTPQEALDLLVSELRWQAKSSFSPSIILTNYWRKALKELEASGLVTFRTWHNMLHVDLTPLGEALILLRSG